MYRMRWTRTVNIMGLTEWRKEPISYLKERLVICNEEDTNGRARMTADKERYCTVVLNDIATPIMRVNKQWFTSTFIRDLVHFRWQGTNWILTWQHTIFMMYLIWLRLTFLSFIFFLRCNYFIFSVLFIFIFSRPYLVRLASVCLSSSCVRRYGMYCG